MTKPRLTIVTATAGAEKAQECMPSWQAQTGLRDAALVVIRQAPGAGTPTPLRGTPDGGVITCSVPDYLGTVPAFKLGVDLALQITAPDGIIACLHDDLLIEEPNWDAKVMAFFNLHSEVGLLGFGGATGLGSEDIYKAPYDPMQLARQDFVSNMRDAEAHGRRSTVPVRVACLDGFSQIGRAEYWKGYQRGTSKKYDDGCNPPLEELVEAGVMHHAYDSYLGAYAHYRGWQVYMLPIRCHHFGGQTAVGDSGYQTWAKQQTPDGDAGLWNAAHAKVYELLRGVLPIRI